MNGIWTVSLILTLPFTLLAAYSLCCFALRVFLDTRSRRWGDIFGCLEELAGLRFFFTAAGIGLPALVFGSQVMLIALGASVAAMSMLFLYVERRSRTARWN